MAFHSSGDNAETIPLPALSHTLQQRLQSEALARIVAEDPLAATRAFYLHVRTFASALLACVSDSTDLNLDNLASLGHHGIFGPLAAFFGAVEPQLRGSLHLHMVLYVYGFNNPQSLVERFSLHWSSLEHSLSTWIDSICQTSVESVAAFWAADPAAALATLQPLPYTDQQIYDTDDIFQDHISLVTHGWHAAAPSLEYIPSEGPWPNPFHIFDSEATDTFVPFALDYLQWGSESSWTDYTSCLLFDVRQTLVACALHSCRPQSCLKGWLGKRGYCRLGFWHWEDVSPLAALFSYSRMVSCVVFAFNAIGGHVPPRTVQTLAHKRMSASSKHSSFLRGTPDLPHTWIRRRGQALCPQPKIQTRFPQLGAFCTQRHHHWLTRFNTSILLTRFLARISCAALPPSIVSSSHVTPPLRKCNHDVQCLLRWPVTRGNAAHPQLLDLIIHSMKSATFYITDYTGKQQPHNEELFRLLYDGQTRLEQELTTTSQLDDHPYRAQRCLMRMAVSAEKRNHKSFQEIVALLLEEPEALCSHAFQNLYFGNALTAVARASSAAASTSAQSHLDDELPCAGFLAAAPSTSGAPASSLCLCSIYTKSCFFFAFVLKAFCCSTTYSPPLSISPFRPALLLQDFQSLVLQSKP